MDVSKTDVLILVLVLVVTALAGNAVYEEQKDYFENCDDKYGEGSWELAQTNRTDGGPHGDPQAFKCVPKESANETDQAD